MTVIVEFDQEIDLIEVLSEILGCYEVTPEEKENPELFVKNHEEDLIQDCKNELDSFVSNIKYDEYYEQDYENQIAEELEESYILDYIKEFFNN